MKDCNKVYLEHKQRSILKVFFKNIEQIYTVYILSTFEGNISLQNALNAVFLSNFSEMIF